MTLSKEDDRSEEMLTAKRRRQAISLRILGASFQSAFQHCVLVQTDPMLVEGFCKGDVGATARLLGNTSGIVGLASLLVNQIGGKLTDSIGRKPGLLVGPVGNIIIGMLVYARPTDRLLVLACRILRLVITTFSNTVVTTAMLSDVLSGQELAQAMSHIGATMGAAFLISPPFESAILKRAGHPRYTYLFLSVLAAVQALYSAFVVPETLDKSRRASMQKVMNWSTLNPLGFVKIFTQGSVALQKMVCVIIAQLTLEGKNISDFTMIFLKSHVGWGVKGLQGWLQLYGFTSFVAGVTLTPRMVKRFHARAFTSITNMANLFAYIARSFTENKGLMFMLSAVPLLPGGNGLSATALKAISADRATDDGFGKGEFSGLFNNLRALVGAATPMLVGQYYAWTRKNGVYAGSTYLLFGLLGGLLPELLMCTVTDEELKVATKK